MDTHSKGYILNKERKWDGGKCKKVGCEKGAMPNIHVCVDTSVFSRVEDGDEDETF